MHPYRHALWNTQRDEVALTPVPQQGTYRELDYAGFIGDEATNGVRAEMPALRKFSHGIVLIVRDVSALKLPNPPPSSGPPARSQRLRACRIRFVSNLQL